MNKKMEIACAFCHKQFNLRSSLEKHQNKCTVQELKKRIHFLESKLQETYVPPKISFQKYIDQITTEEITDEKANDVFIKAFKKWFEKGEEVGCVKLHEKMVFDETSGWIPFKNISSECIEKIFRVIQSSLLSSLKKDDSYYKNVIKLTKNKKWPNIYRHI